VFSSIYNASHVVTTVDAGNFVSAQLSGDEGGASMGVTLSGRPSMVIVPDTTRTMVTTDREAIAIDGIFTAKFGDSLLLQTMIDGSKRLCVQDDRDSCKSVLK
jgi:hypothetical protein